MPALARHGEAGHEAVVRVLVEHVDLRRRAVDIAADTDLPLHQLRELGERMHAHVRDEERVLFRLIEQAVPEPELAALAAALGEN